MFDRFLTEGDGQRVECCLDKLSRHRVMAWALTGSVAIEIRRIERSGGGSIRRLNDLDFVSTSFQYIPNTLSEDFLFRHLHPLDPPDKLIAQFVAPDVALRVDVFRTHESIMDRATLVNVGTRAVRVVSVEDLTARAARLTMPLVENRPVPSKHATDLIRLLQITEPDDVECAWRDHRRRGDPESFNDAATLLRELIPHRSDLLITPKYSQNPAESCSRCVPAAGFKLADPATILSLLGYC